ncbi:MULTISPECIES: 1,2-phenylacetyl-CoA epoxidase subunit PaaC [unclassified Saccharopolyspora]|uniref:1,2-phenylacetyl-CoA epoxidase subunit PaaC n=2 Tax=Pseudonocardiaceae TaxID=2070 RepID=UPI00190ACCF2|nr:1,2-phenylacetyl-CoA epoxidase subunit PaaC [Saccharopolyspora sp. HNM0986]MBK0869267.1 phenylacetate-CoA oxygenase subunit PaaC [Saccharopolyspora sp. HNM0986]
MSFDNAYEALTEQNDSRWAFGTGFDDPLSGVDGSVPDGVDGAVLAHYCLALGDDALIAAQRLSEWVTRAPELEDEVALANIALDLLGQARLLLARAGQADGSGRGEDSLAYFRDAAEFRNVRLAELPRGDFAEQMARLLVLSSWRLALCARLVDSRDPVLAAVAAKSVKELTYHRDYAAQWVVRLGDGTAESHRRMCEGIAAVRPHLAELFHTHEIERRAVADGVGVDPAEVRGEVDEVLARAFAAATLPHPGTPPAGDELGRAGEFGRGGEFGRAGEHTEHLVPLLAEMQGLARAHPEATW